MDIRTACEADVIDIRRIHEASIRDICSQDYPADVISAWLGGIRDERYRQRIRLHSFWLVEEQRKVIAFGSVHIERGKLESLFVAPDSCGKGIAGLLLAHLESIATATRIPVLKVDASLSAKVFYAKHGYEEADGDASVPLDSGIVIRGIPMFKKMSLRDGCFDKQRLPLPL